MFGTDYLCGLPMMKLKAGFRRIMYSANIPILILCAKEGFTDFSRIGDLFERRAPREVFERSVAVAFFPARSSSAVERRPERSRGKASGAGGLEA